MSAVQQLIASFSQSANAPSVSYVGTQVSDADASSYSFTQSVGVGLLVIVFAGESSSGTPAYSATVDGNAVTMATFATGTVGGSRQNIAIGYYNVTTAGSKTIVCNFGLTVVRCRMLAWTVSDSASSTPNATANAVAVSSTDTSVSLPLSTAAASSVAIAGIITNNGSMTITWSNATARFSGSSGEVGWWVSGADATALTGPTTISAAIAGTNGFAAVAASWR